MKQVVLDLIAARKQEELNVALAKVEAVFQPLIDAVAALPDGDVSEEVAQLKAKVAELELVVAEQKGKLEVVDGLAKQIDASIEDAPQV